MSRCLVCAVVDQGWSSEDACYFTLILLRDRGPFLVYDLCPPHTERFKNKLVACPAKKDSS